MHCRRLQSHFTGSRAIAAETARGGKAYDTDNLYRKSLLTSAETHWPERSGGLLGSNPLYDSSEETLSVTIDQTVELINHRNCKTNHNSLWFSDSI